MTHILDDAKEKLTSKTNDDHLTNKDLKRITATCFLAWVLSVYDFTLFGTLLPAISKDLGWSLSYSTEIATWVTFGTFIVSLVISPFLDRYGRRTMLIITMTGAALSCGVTGLAIGAVSMVIVRSLSGFGYSEEVVNSMYINEVFRNSKRKGLIYGFVQGGWPVGAFLGAGLTAILLPLIGWRWSFAVAMIPSIFVVFYARKLPESPVYLALKRLKEARKAGNDMLVLSISSKYGIDLSEKSDAKLADLFDKKMRVHSFCSLMVWFLNWMTVQVLLVLGTTVLTEGKGVSFENSLLILVFGNLIGYLGFIIHGWLGDKIGRRNTVIFGWTCAFFVTSALLFGPEKPAYIYTLYAISLFFVSGPVAALMFYFGESFPRTLEA